MGPGGSAQEIPGKRGVKLEGEGGTSLERSPNLTCPPTPGA